MYERLIIIVLILLILITGLWIFNDERCHIQAKSFDSYSFDVLGGCMVSHNGQWIPLDNIHMNNN